MHDSDPTHEGSQVHLLGKGRTFLTDKTAVGWDAQVNTEITIRHRQAFSLGIPWAQTASFLCTTLPPPPNLSCEGQVTSLAPAESTSTVTELLTQQREQ